LKPNSSSDLVLFNPRPAIQWKNDPSAQRHVGNRDFRGTNPQGGTAVNVWAKSDLGAGKLEFLQGTTVASTMEVNVKAGMNRFQWAMRGPAPPAANGGRRGGRGADAPAADTGAAGAPNPAGAPNAPGSGEAPAEAAGGRGGRGGRGGPAGVPFVASGRGFGGGGGGGGGFGFGAPQGPLVEPGVYMVRLTVGDKVLNSSVTVLEDIWMRPQ
jgi:hypothetical protein